MVWQLTTTANNPGPIAVCNFTSPGAYKVGRKDCTVTINIDKTVSRLHAEVIIGPSPQVLPAGGDTIPKPAIKVKDLSKFGTFINKQQESKAVSTLPDSEAPLRDGDIVTFGSGHCSYRLTFIPLALCVQPDLSKSKEQIVQRAAREIGAFLVDSWSPLCTHLLTESGGSPSPLVYEAVAAGKPVVTLEWIQDFAGRDHPSKPMPDPASYLPSFLLSSSKGTPLSYQVVLPHARHSILSDWVVLLGATAPYDPHLRDLITAAGGQLEDAGLQSGKKHRQLLYVKASKATETDEDPAGAESCQRTSEQRLLVAILAGQLRLADIAEPQVPAVSEKSRGTEATTDEEMEEAGEEVAGPVGDGWNSTPHIRTTQAAKATTRPIIVPPGRRSTADPSTAAQPPTPATSAHATSAEADQQNGPDSKADVVFEPGLVTVDLNLPQPVYNNRATEAQASSTGPNFKRFSKVHPIGGAGNSFESLIPFAREAYKESTDMRNREVDEYLQEEKARSVAAAKADDLFNADKIKRQKAAAKPAPPRDDSSMPPPKPRAPAKRKR